MLAVNLRKLGIETTFVDPDDPETFAARCGRTRAPLFAETLGNPQSNVLDIEAVADIAHAHGMPLVVDNTVPSPYPVPGRSRWGADIVVHSATKYLGGHGTTHGRRDRRARQDSRGTTASSPG